VVNKLRNTSVTQKTTVYDGVRLNWRSNGMTLSQMRRGVEAC